MRPMIATVMSLMVLAASQATAAPRVDKNVVYGMYSGMALLLDVHYPEQSNGYGVVFVAGSGWRAPLTYDGPGLKDRELDTSVLPLARAGYTVFTISHRATPRFQNPAPLEDVQRAVRFVRNHAKEYGIDPSRIGGVGGSSGAHLVGLTAMIGAPGVSDDRDPVEREPATLQCLVLRAAPSDLRAMAGGDGVVLMALFMGIPPGNSPPVRKAYTEASPIAHVSRLAPPVLLIHGDADKTVPYAQSVAMEKALRAADVPVKLVTIPGGAHGADFGARKTPHPEWPDYTGEMIQWLDSHLKAPPPDRRH